MHTEHTANEELSNSYETMEETKKQWQAVLAPSKRKLVKPKKTVLEFLQFLFITKG